MPQLQRGGEAGGQGLPAPLQRHVSEVSGYDLGDVRVHRNSPKPGHIDAQAYAQGNEVFLSPGQEKHLAHEAWHVVQQRRGEVRAQFSAGSIALNADPRLEAEADRMGQLRPAAGGIAPAPMHAAAAAVAQAVLAPADSRALDLYIGQIGIFLVNQLRQSGLAIPPSEAPVLRRQIQRARGQAQRCDTLLAAKAVIQQAAVMAVLAGIAQMQQPRALPAPGQGPGQGLGQGVGQRPPPMGQMRMFGVPYGAFMGAMPAVRRAPLALMAPARGPPRRDDLSRMPFSVIERLVDLLGTADHVSALRATSSGMRQKVDAAYVNPRNWIVLHRLKGLSFAGMLRIMGINEQRGQVAFERTNSKYAPEKYPDADTGSITHRWEGNLEWLREVTEARIPHVALTDGPLSLLNVMRQTLLDNHNRQKPPSFSAYARELAFLLLHGYEVPPQARRPGLHVMVRCVPASPLQQKNLATYVRELKAILAGTPTVLVDGLQALRIFAAFGFPIAKEAREGMEKAASDVKERESPQRKIIIEYFAAKKYAKKDPMNWDAKDLEGILKLVFPGRRFTKREGSDMRATFAKMFPKGEGL